jgi:mannose-6-phosphate isomerase-like protein (cupin superfamily)
VRQSANYRNHSLEIIILAMSIYLEGGCFVSHMLETSPLVAGTLTQRNVIGSSTGAQSISLRVLEFQKGLSPGMRSDADTVLYRLENSNVDEDSNCTVYIDGTPHKAAAQTGIYIHPGQTMTVLNEGEEPVVFIGSQCPESAESSLVEAVVESEVRARDGGASQSINLKDRESIPTADRWYRVLVDDGLGSTKVTQFVGSIPPGRAPDHFHHYEEVLFILRGQGRMWAGKTNTPIVAGTCIYLPKRQLHCVENTGEGELRLLGVFYPAGSPAVRYEA